MNEAKIALAFVALGVALLVGTFAYLAYDGDGGTRSPGAPDAESVATAVPGEQEEKRRSGAAGVGADEPEATPAPRSAEARGVDDALAEGAPPAGGEPAPSEPPAPVRGAAEAPADASASGEEGVPAYGAPVRESHADGVTEVVVGTEATEEDEMRLVASDLLASNYPGAGVLLVEFREGASGDASAGRETGFALVFGSREAAKAADLEYTPEEVDEIFEKDGGVRAVSYEDFGRENPGLRDDLARISSP